MVELRTFYNRDMKVYSKYQIRDGNRTPNSLPIKKLGISWAIVSLEEDGPGSNLTGI